MRSLIRLGMPAAVAAMLALPAGLVAQDLSTAIAGPDAQTFRSAWQAPVGMPDGLTPVGFGLSSSRGFGVSGIPLSTRSGNSTAFHLMSSPRLFVAKAPDACSNDCTRVPEPATGGLLMLGLLAVGIVGVRRNRLEVAPLRT
jgi:hypothetical protein